MIRFLRRAVNALLNAGSSTDSLAVRLSTFGGMGAFDLESETDRNAVFGHIKVCKLMLTPIGLIQPPERKAFVREISQSLRTLNVFLCTIRYPDLELLSRVRLTAKFMGGLVGSTSSLKRMGPQESPLSMLARLCQEMRIEGDLMTFEDLERIEEHFGL